MKKILPEKGSKPTGGTVHPEVVSPGITPDGEAPMINISNPDTFLKRSPSGASTVSTTSAASERAKECIPPPAMQKGFPSHSDSGFGALNPLFDEGDESQMPPDLPSPLKPTIPTSQSLPAMVATSSSPGIQASATASPVNLCSTTTSVTSARASPSQQTVPPKSPSSTSPISRHSSPRRSKSCDSSKTNPDAATPPNSPFSHPPSPKEGSPSPKDHEDSEEVIYPFNPVMGQRGQLYDVFGTPVDRPDTKPKTRRPSKVSLEKDPIEPLPFATYPKDPYIWESIEEKEQALRNLINLSGGVVDGEEEKKVVPENLEEVSPEAVSVDIPEKSGKSPDKLEAQEDLVTACWIHKLGADKDEDKTQKREDDDKIKDHDKGLQREGLKKSPNVKDGRRMNKRPNEEKTPNGNLRDIPKTIITRCGKSPEGSGTEDEEELKRRSLFADLQIPMIDDDVDYRKPDTPPDSKGDGSPTISGLSQAVAAELAEQLCEVTTEAGELIAKEIKEGLEYLTQPEDTLSFTWIDAITGIIGLGTFYFDLVSDALVPYYMYDDPDSQSYFLVALLLLILPLALANGFSLYWYWFDERICHVGSFKHPHVPKYIWALRILAHLTLQAPTLRQIDILYYGIKSTDETATHEALVDEVMEAALENQEEENGEEHVIVKSRRGSSRLSYRRQRSSANSEPEPLSRRVSICSRKTGGVCAKGGYVALWIHAERDAANVDLLLSLVQDAPLLIMNLYIVTKTLPLQALQGQISKTIMMQIFSISASLLTLAWSVASFVRAIRLTEPSLSNLSLLDLLFLTLAHFCSIAGQVMSFGLFASQWLISFSIIITTHWLFMSTWILIQLLCFPRTSCTRAAFAHDQRVGPCNRLDDLIYSCTMGLIFLFTFVDVSGLAPKTQSVLYHILRLIEEAVLLTLWFVWVDGTAWYYWLPLFLVPVLFGLTLLFDGLYVMSTRPYTAKLLSSKSTHSL